MLTCDCYAKILVILQGKAKLWCDSSNYVEYCKIRGWFDSHCENSKEFFSLLMPFKWEYSLCIGENVVALTIQVWKRTVVLKTTSNVNK